MADFSFRKQMDALGVDVDSLNIIDQDPASGAVALAEGAVSMACIFGGASAAKPMKLAPRSWIMLPLQRLASNPLTLCL